MIEGKNIVEGDFMDKDKKETTGLQAEEQITVVDLENLLGIVNSGKFEGTMVEYIAILKNKLIKNIQINKK